MSTGLALWKLYKNLKDLQEVQSTKKTFKISSKAIPPDLYKYWKLTYKHCIALLNVLSDVELMCFDIDWLFLKLLYLPSRKNGWPRSAGACNIGTKLVLSSSNLISRRILDIWLDRRTNKKPFSGTKKPHEALDRSRKTKIVLFKVRYSSINL